jgi:hypothetical protein
MVNTYSLVLEIVTTQVVQVCAISEDAALEEFSAYNSHNMKPFNIEFPETQSLRCARNNTLVKQISIHCDNE